MSSFPFVIRVLSTLPCLEAEFGKPLLGIGRWTMFEIDMGQKTITILAHEVGYEDTNNTTLTQWGRGTEQVST